LVERFIYGQIAASFTDAVADWVTPAGASVHGCRAFIHARHGNFCFGAIVVDNDSKFVSTYPRNDIRTAKCATKQRRYLHQELRSCV
jgi:hypothetical protein